MRLHVIHVPGADPARDEIVAHLREVSEACVHTDPTRRGVMPTFLEALACAASTDLDLGWSVIVQDDALPLPGWVPELKAALAHSPEPVLGLTHFGGYGEDLLRRGIPYGVGEYLVWGGAVAYRRDIVAGLCEWMSFVWERTRYPHDDCLVASYAMRSGFRTALAVRAIFDQPVKASLLNHHSRWRSPNTTIADPGPAWDAVPCCKKLHRQVWPEIKAMASIDPGVRL